MSYNDDMKPPRVFTVVTSGKMEYNMDFVSYLMKQESDRRVAARQRPLSQWESEEFKRQLISRVIIQNDTSGAIALRPTLSTQLLQE